jgi:predicted GTPase
VTKASDTTLDRIAEIFEAIKKDRHLQFLYIDPEGITSNEIGFDRTGRLRAWSQLEKVVCSIGDLRTHQQGLAFVGVLGHFTSGKSTLINAIVGDAQQRKADPNPTDKTITLICHPKNIAELSRNSFTSIDGISIDSGPSIELLEDIVLVDTPGLGNAAAEHEMAERFLHLCHVIIVTIDGQVPLADTAGNLMLLDKAINKLGQVPKIFAVTKSVKFLKDRKGDFDTENWDQTAAESFWRGVKSRLTSDTRFVGAGATIDDIPVVFVDSIDDYNIKTLIDKFVPITRDESQRPRTYDAQTKYVAQVALDAMKVFNAYLKDRLANLSSLHTQASLKATEAKNTLSTRQDGVLTAITTATAKIDALQQADGITQRLLPVPAPTEFLLRDRYGEFHAAINGIENHLKKVELESIEPFREETKRASQGHFRIFFCNKKAYPRDEVCRGIIERLVSLRPYDEHELLTTVSSYFEKAHGDIVWDIKSQWSHGSLERSAHVITMAFTEAFQALAGGLGAYISSYNVAAKAFVAYLAQPNSRKLLAEYGVVLFDDEDEDVALKAAELSTSDFSAYGAADKVSKEIKGDLATIVSDEVKELSEANIGDIEQRLAIPSFGHEDLKRLYDGRQLEFEEEVRGFLSDVQANIETSKAQMSTARAKCKDQVKDIWLGWLEFAVKICVVWLVLFVTIAVIKRSDLDLYGWLADFAATSWVGLLLSVVGALVVELFKFGIKRDNEFVSPSTFSFGFRAIYDFSREKSKIVSAFHEKVDAAIGVLKQKISQRKSDIGARIQRTLGLKIDASVEEAGVTELRDVLQKYRDDRVTTYQRSRQSFADSANTLKTELTTVSEGKGKESVDIVLDRISDTQTAVTAFSEEMQGFEKELALLYDDDVN